MSTPVVPDLGDLNVDPAASEPGESQVAPAPVEGDTSAVESELGSLVDRYKSAGLDLSTLDPVTLARAHGIAQKIGDKEYYTHDQMPQVFQDGMQRLASTPEGRQLMQSYMGALSEPAPSAGAAGDEDPYESRFSSIENQMRQLVEVGQQLMGRQDQAGRERSADKDIASLTDHFSQAVSSVAGASESPLLERLFWAEVNTGGIPRELFTAPGVRSWVTTVLGTEQKARARKKSRRAPVETGGGAIESKDLSKMTPDEFQKALEASLPE